MCGIAGLLQLDGRAADAAQLRAMIAQVRYRGPDDSGCLAAGPLGFAHARLSIVDPSGGHQPMSNAAGTHHVTFNGEIYNHVELREELERAGRVFATRCDTEVLLAAYERWGEDCVSRFNGQWAFAIWDGAARRLFLSRDRLGVRPLYYTRTSGRFAFASEVKSLFALPDVPRELDPHGLDQVLTLWSTRAPRTVFRDVQELPPGHNLTLRADGSAASLRSYWDLDYGVCDESRPEGEWIEELRALLIDAARLRLLRSDVPVGAYLSGGLDSTAVVALVRRFSSSPLKTFSVVFEDREFDERPFQDEAIRALGVEHQQVLCRAADIGRVFPDVIWHTEQPVVRTAPAPLYLLSALVREHGYKVVLTGEGSDELLGGYDIYKEAKLRRLCATHLESSLRPALFRRLYPYIPGLQAQPPQALREYFAARPEDLDDPFFSHRPRWALTAAIKPLLSDALRATVARDETERALRASLPAGYAGWSPFAQAQYIETRTLLPGYILSSQGDRVAMAHSVEGRFPFLDARVVELSARIPPRLKMRGLTEKYVLKEAVRGLVPDAVRKRPKQPYRAPDVPSFFAPGARGAARFEYVNDMLAPATLARAGVFRPEPVARLLDKVRRGGTASVRDSMALVAVLSTQLVWAQFVDRFRRLSDEDH